MFNFDCVLSLMSNRVSVSAGKASLWLLWNFELEDDDDIAHAKPPSLPPGDARRTDRHPSGYRAGGDASARTGQAAKAGPWTGSARPSSASERLRRLQREKGWRASSAHHARRHGAGDLRTVTRRDGGAPRPAAAALRRLEWRGNEGKILWDALYTVMYQIRTKNYSKLNRVYFEKRSFSSSGSR